MEDMRNPTATMRATADQLLAEVSAMPLPLITWKPAPDVWSVLENLCHVAEFVPYWTGQVAQIVTDPGQEWGRTHHDPERLAAVAAAPSRTLADVEEQLRSVVQRSSAELETFTPQQLTTEAPSRNPRWGVQPASFVVDTLLVKHLQSHLSQVRRNVSQYQQQETRS